MPLPSLSLPKTWALHRCQSLQVHHYCTVDCSSYVSTGWPLLCVRTSSGFEHHLVEPTHAEALQREGHVLNSAGKRGREEE